ncbi:hypothetical protein HY413_00375 [Candidatus Kaiserbacteria bacterium]|nr:hypothetical protein [Candidatus Kaiserbacteria bacterium]
MALQRLKEQARLLRKGAKSITEIASVLNVSKSTASYWCRDIALSKSQLHVLAERQHRGGALGRLRAAELKRAQRIERVNFDMAQGAQDVGVLNKRDLFILGLALYWGEGYKNGNEECGLSNSDPAIIVIFIAWLRDMYGIRKDDLILRVSLNETHRHRAATVEKYWSHITRIPLCQFTKTSLIRARVKKRYANTSTHFGTLRVKVRKGTSLRRRIIGSINASKKQNAEI